MNKVTQDRPQSVLLASAATVTIPGNATISTAKRLDASSNSQLRNMFYVFALAASIATWFLAIGSPLWLDETASYWQISGGFSQIPSRTLAGLYFPPYFYLLWLTKTLFGSSELVLRLPSVIAMGSAIYFLYRSARDLFDHDVAMIVCIMFCLDPHILFMSIETRPYAFGELATAVAVFAFIRWSRTHNIRFAVLFGFSSATILYFHYVFAVVLPAFVVCYLMDEDLRKDIRGFCVALASFLITLSPAIPRLREVFITRSTHIHAAVPSLGLVLLPLWPVAGAIIASSIRRYKDGRTLWLCVSTVLVPHAILYGIAVLTPLHIYLMRYTTVASVGLALCWGLLIACVLTAPVYRQAVCLFLIALNAIPVFASPASRFHGYTWKYALEFAARAAAPDHAPLLICSDFPEADFETMPQRDVTNDINFAPLNYYRIDATVVALPRALNAEAIRVGSGLIDSGGPRHQRFLALAYQPSYATLDWLLQRSSRWYTGRLLENSSGILIFEFVPKDTAQVTP